MTADPTNSPVPVPGWLPIETAVRTQARHHDLVEAAGIEVDAEMAPILEKLWSVGIETHQSCQGFPRTTARLAFLRCGPILRGSDSTIWTLL